MTWADFPIVMMQENGIHPSEWAWIGTQFDAVIDNNADGLDPLFAQVKNLVLNLQAAKANLLA